MDVGFRSVARSYVRICEEGSVNGGVDPSCARRSHAFLLALDSNREKVVTCQSACLSSVWHQTPQSWKHLTAIDQRDQEDGRTSTSSIWPRSTRKIVAIIISCSVIFLSLAD